MKLTSKCEYGLLALLYMARQDQQRPVSVAEIAEAQEIPRKFLEQILHGLKLAGYLRSSKGPAGGFRLAMTPDKVSLAKVIRALDGALAPTESVSTYFYESTPIEREAGLVRVFKDIRDYISDKLEGTSLADLCEADGKQKKKKAGVRDRARRATLQHQTRAFVASAVSADWGQASTRTKGRS